MEVLGSGYHWLTQYVSPTVLWIAVSFFIFKFLKDQIENAIKLSIIAGFIFALVFNSFEIRDRIMEIIQDLMYSFF